MKKSNKKINFYINIEKFQKNSKNAGITLLALVITIVILLIISTVSITLLVNNNLTGNAKLATDKYNNSVEKENSELAKLYNETENLQSTREDAQGASNPVGCIISQMGTTAPTGYLACDGSVYDISAYPNLAAYINEQFGSYDYFKIGSETVPEGQFKVPNLQGEFLRGSGANGHSNQGNGTTVGAHQDGTVHMDVGSQGNGFIQINYSGALANQYAYNVDSRYRQRIGWSNANQKASGSSTNANMGEYTSRPTTTSVLYCIKY